MYRQYENPYEIEEALEEAKAELVKAWAVGDEDAVISLSETVHELEERLNFAWQDDEYDSE